MKRILTKACDLTAIGIVAAILIVQFAPRTFADQPLVPLVDPDIIFSENPEQAAADEAVFRAVEEVEPAALAVDQTVPDVREEMLKLLRRRVELMNETELPTLFAMMKKEVAELEAARKLQAIQSELQALIQSHPDTHAARRAERLLESVDANVSEERLMAAVRSLDPNGPAFIKVNEIVVNLNEGRLNRYLDVLIVLQVTASRRDEVSVRFEAKQAILQNWLLSHMSEQTLDSLRGAAGQERLRTEIKDHFNATLFEGEDPAIEDVLFQKFAVQ